MVAAELKELVEKLAEGRGIKEIVEEKEPSLLAAVSKLKIRFNDGGVKLLVYKRYTGLRGLKWIPVEWYIFPAATFNLNPRRLLINEVSFNLKLRSLGFKTPKIYAVSWRRRSVLMEYVHGKQLPQHLRDGRFKVFYRVGESLARLHSKGICLVDTRPQNMIVDDRGDLVFIDLEQARTRGDRAWDIALHIYYSVKFTLNRDKARSIVSTFAQGYLEKGDAEDLKRATAAKYLRVFLPLVLPPTLKAVVSELKKTS